jgi:hypothetical protein
MTRDAPPVLRCPLCDVIRHVLLLTLATGLALVALYGACVLLGRVAPASAHDIYHGVTNSSGRLCCGGDPQTGDCEALEAEQIVYGRASLRIFSKRYKAWVMVDPLSVEHRSIDGDKGAAGHFCGVKRTPGLHDTVNDEQPDPTYFMYCIFISPGGV